jgi:hypothetical protein
MSSAEWGALSPERQHALIAGGKASQQIPTASQVTKPPTEFQSPKAKALLERIAEGNEHIFALQQLWISLELCECAPDARQFGLWFYKHEFEVVSDAFSETAIWLSKLRQKGPEGGGKTHDDKVRYASAVMNGMARAANQVTVNQTFSDGEELPPDWGNLDATEKRKLIAIHKSGCDE